MRIVQVSAHYPPELVSGGTLQPQRIARSQRARGHDVRVLAGSLDGGRDPLSTWDDVDDTGLPVRWVATHPYVWWDDERNYDNAGVTAVAGALYDEHQPDVVHCHALQTLGVGPIDAAAERGIRVVVTMHDFWWVCARQFLVDTANEPCSLVVAASDCPCEAGRPHLARRTARLRTALSRVDQVLVPSPAAAEVLIANGVDARLVAVDENGLPPTSGGTSPARPARAAGAPVTVRYTGGSNALKGADVVLAALDHVGPLAHVRVVAHDLDEALERHHRSAASIPAELQPAYAPEQLDAVLADTDVLLLPSVMRETFSIVTREALERGVPVIATEVLGPEEVVDDGRNGRLIPAGDPAALAAVLRSIDDEPALVDRWTRGVTRPALRSVDDQADALLERYTGLIAGGPHAAPESVSASVLFVVGIDGAPLRYRAQLPAEALREVGARATIVHYRDPALPALAAGATHVVVYRVPATPIVLELIAGWRAAGTPVAFDVDDLIFDPDISAEIPALRLLPQAEADLWLEGVRRYRTTMEACDAYIGSTRRLVEHAREVVGLPAHLFENGVGQSIGAASDRALRRARRPGPLRIGYLSGTTTHDDDWRAIATPVLAVLQRHPEVELWLGGHLTVDELVRQAMGPRLRRIPFTAWDELPEVLRDLDVNLAPLAPDSRFNDAKSAIKWLEAALCETPTVATPTEPFRQAIDDGRTGLLAEDGAAWDAALELLLTDHDARERMGRRARRRALLTWGPPLQGRRYLDVLAAISAAGTAPRASSGWTGTVVDEPFERHRIDLTPYPAHDPPARTWTTARDAYLARQPSVAVRQAARLGASLRADGVLVTASRVARVLVRRARRR